MTRCGNVEMSPQGRLAVEAFNNFLSWGEQPRRPGSLREPRRAVPPAWWAYARGHTAWCPPVGEM